MANRFFNLRLLSVTYTLLTALLLVLAGGWAVERPLLWAFSFLLFVPLWLRLLAAGLLILAALSLILRPPARWSVAAGWARLRAEVRVIPTFVWSLLAGLLFWLGREQTWSGDALLKLELLRTHSLQSDPYIWKEPLDSLLAYTVTGWLRAFGQPPEMAIALLSIGAGCAYVAAVLYIAKLEPSPITQSSNYSIPNPQFLIALLALGSSQLWFGHVENYSLVTAAAFSSIVLAAGYLAGRAPLWAVGLASGLAISFHPQALFVLPALLLLLERKQWLRQGLILLGAGLVAPLLTGLALVGAGAPLPDFTHGYAGDPQLFLTWPEIFRPDQLLAAGNNLWLIAPLAPWLLISGFWAWTQPTLRADRTFRYLTAVAGGLLVYHFSFQNDLPRWRDWDLFAIAAPGLTLWGLYPFVATPLLSKPERQRWLWPPLLFALFFTGAWIGVNHHFVLIQPDPNQWAIYQRYQVLDLTAALPRATISPAAPICVAATDCERVKSTIFTMPEDGDSRPTIFAHAPARIELPLAVPSVASFLWLSPALDPAARGWGGDGVTFAVAVKANGQETTLWSRHLAPDQPADLDWQTLFVPLDSFQGQTVTLILSTTPGPANNDAADRAGWGLPWLMRGTVDGRFGR